MKAFVVAAETVKDDSVFAAYRKSAALTNVAGAEAGLAIVVSIVATGLTSLIANMGYWFD